MSTEIVEELVIAKRMAEQQTQQMLNIVGAVMMANGSTKTGDNLELRVSKAALNKLDGRQVAIRSLKAGGVVITVKELDDA